MVLPKFLRLKLQRNLIWTSETATIVYPSGRFATLRNRCHMGLPRHRNRFRQDEGLLGRDPPQADTRALKQSQHSCGAQHNAVAVNCANFRGGGTGERELPGHHKIVVVTGYWWSIRLANLLLNPSCRHWGTKRRRRRRRGSARPQGRNWLCAGRRWRAIAPTAAHDRRGTPAVWNPSPGLRKCGCNLYRYTQK